MSTGISIEHIGAAAGTDRGGPAQPLLTVTKLVKHFDLKKSASFEF